MSQRGFRKRTNTAVDNFSPKPFLSVKGKSIFSSMFLQSVDYFFYLYNMNAKPKKGKKKLSSREQIMQSALASFRIEGIYIPKEMALQVLKKVELSLGR